MPIRPSIAIIAGALAVTCIGLFGAASGDSRFAADLSRSTERALDDAGLKTVRAEFTSYNGWPGRHPLLSGGDQLDEAERARAANIVASVSGVGGVRWIDGTMVAESGNRPKVSMHCQDDVEALLESRTIRFEESSSAMDAGSMELLEEVEAALRPCLGSIIAIVGHTDNSGPEEINLALSRQRANAVRQALISRGIPRDALRARGVGSSDPVEGLDITDPANRRIEFSVISTEPLKPTPVDTPGAR